MQRQHSSSRRERGRLCKLDRTRWYAMEALNSTTIVDKVDNTEIMDSVAVLADCIGAVENADTANPAGDVRTVNNAPDSADTADFEQTANCKDVPDGLETVKLLVPTSVNIADSVDNVEKVDSLDNADIVSTEGNTDCVETTDSRSMEIDDSVDSVDSSTQGDSNDCESDSDGTNESACLEAMTPDGQEHYLRLGDTPRRRSALRLSRIIARQQLLRRLEQGRNGEKAKLMTFN